MSEDLTGEITETPSHDETVESSTTPVADVLNIEASATEKPEEAKKPNKVQERINQLTREKYEARQREAELEQRLKTLEATKPIETPDRVAPNEDDYDSLQEYHTANAQYYADVSSDAAQARVTADNQAREKVTQETEQQKAIETKKKAFESNLDKKRENFEDFEDIAYGHTFMDLDLAEQIFDMDKGPEVAYHLGSNLDVAERIFALTPVQRARELTKLEFQVEALKPKLVSDAPDAIAPLGNSESVDVDPDKMTADQWQQWEYNRQRAKAK